MNTKTQKAWAFYDWANSVYSLVISTAIFPIYFTAVTADVNDGQINIFGRSIEHTALYSYLLSASLLIVSLVSPLLSGIADYSGKKKRFMQFFCYLGAASCSSLYFFTGQNIGFGLIMSGLASIGFWGSLVFYNAFLPEIAPPEEQDRLSAKGYSLGYIGSSILLILCLVLINMHETFGIESTGEASRISFLMVGIWWFGFSQYSFKHLPNNPFQRVANEPYLFKGYHELRKVLGELKSKISLRRFLYSFFFFSMGVQTVIVLATPYGLEELGLDSTKLIVTVLLIQFVGIAGAYLFSYLSKKFGNLQSLKISIFIWAGICYGAYSMSKLDPFVEYKFYLLGAVVGLVMGGIQSVSRSTYSKLLPATQSHASYFSFYDVSEKVAMVIGTAVYGLLIELTGSMKMSALSLSIFFIIGFILILRVKSTKHVY